MNLHQTYLIGITLPLLFGCSGDQLYRSGQEWQKSQCIEHAVSKAQYDECMNTEAMTFEEYQQERNR